MRASSKGRVIKKAATKITAARKTTTRNPAARKGTARKTAARKTAAPRIKSKAVTARRMAARSVSKGVSVISGSDKTTAASTKPLEMVPFERFTLDFIHAAGGETKEVAPREYQATFGSDLAKKLKRRSARLIFDAHRGSLPRGSVFVAPGSRFGLALLDAARSKGHVSRSRLPVDPSVDVKELADAGYKLHGASAIKSTLGDMRWVCQMIYHMTLTLKGGVAEQDLRAVLADPRGPVFEFLVIEGRKSWNIRPGFPESPVWWGESDISHEIPKSQARDLWKSLLKWLNQVQQSRLLRWRKRCEESRDSDLLRINDYYEERLREEAERRRRRREDFEEEDGATVAQLKLEWSRRAKSIRSRWKPEADLRVWGIEELARPRVPVRWELETPDGPASIEGEVDLAEGSLTRLQCPVCGRLAGEFWWQGQLVCRRCRSGQQRSGGGGTREGRTLEAAGSRSRQGGLRRGGVRP